jgi:hypothetical protein
MNKIIPVLLALTAFALIHPVPAQAQGVPGHENNCTVVNVSASSIAVQVVCASGTVNYGFLTGALQLGNPATSCPTIDFDTLKLLFATALTARATGLVLTVWYSDQCIPGTLDIHAIQALEMKGN